MNYNKQNILFKYHNILRYKNLFKYVTKLGIYFFGKKYFILLAQDLAKEQKVNYGDDIACLIRLARKKRFNVAEEKRINQEIELQVSKL